MHSRIERCTENPMKEHFPSPPRVAIVQPQMQHYRVPLYRRMFQEQVARYHVWFGRECLDASMKTVQGSDFPDEMSERLHPVRNVYQGGRLRWQTRIVSLAWRRGTDVIIFAGMADTISTWFAAIVARLRGKRVVFWTHGFRRKTRGLKERIRERFYRLAHCLVHYGFGSRKLAISRGFAEPNQYVCLNSLDHETQLAIREELTPEAVAETRKKLTGNVRTPILTWVGRITKPKSLSMLLDVAQSLRASGQYVFCLFIGDGPELPALRRYAATLGLADQVDFVGACYDEQHLGCLLAASDLCVAPGEIGLACIHSMTFGTPVITHDDPGRQGPEHEAILPGHTGDFFRRGDLTDLTRTIVAWLAAHENREVIRKECYSVVDNYFTPSFQVSAFNAAVLGEQQSLPRETDPEALISCGEGPATVLTPIVEAIEH